MRNSLLIHLGVSIALTIAIGMLDSEVLSIWDLFKLENLPAMFIYTCLFFPITILLRAIIDWPFARAVKTLFFGNEAVQKS